MKGTNSVTKDDIIRKLVRAANKAMRCLEPYQPLTPESEARNVLDRAVKAAKGGKQT